MAASVSDAANLDGEGLDGDDCAASGAFSWETVRNLSDALCMGDLDLSDPNARLNTVFQYNASALIEVSQTGPCTRVTKKRRARKRDVLSQPPLIGSARGAEIDLAFRQRGQLLVGGLFLVQRLLQQARAIVTAKLPRPCDQAAIACDLIMLGRLRRVDQRGIQHGLVGDFARSLVSLLDDAVDRRTVDRLHRKTMHLEDLLEPLDVSLCFLEMRQKALFQLGIRGLVRHLRQRLHQLLLCIVDVLQLVREQVIHGLDVFGEQSHGCDPFVLGLSDELLPVHLMSGCRYRLTDRTRRCSGERKTVDGTYWSCPA